MRLKAVIEVEYAVNEASYDECGHVDMENIILCQEQCRLIDKIANLASPLVTGTQNIKVKVEEAK